MVNEKASNPGLEIFHTLLKAHRASDREAMSLASVGSYVETAQAMQHSRKRHDAQVDAALKSKYAQCGLEDIYEPPEESADAMGTMINCTFNGDETIQQLANLMQQQAGAEVPETNGFEPGTEQPEQPAGPSEPAQPQPQEPSPPPIVINQSPPAKPTWRRLTDFMLPLAAGAGITAGGFALSNMGKEPTPQDTYDIRALPWEPFPGTE